MTAAGRGREERGSSTLALRSALLCLRLCPHLVPKPPSRSRPRIPRVGPRPPPGPQTLSPSPDSPGPPTPAVSHAARGRRVSALSWPPGAPSHGPGGTRREGGAGGHAGPGSQGEFVRFPRPGRIL